MDKEILRIVIIATGLLIMMSMLLWGYLKNRKSSDNIKLFDADTAIGHINESLKLHPEHDEYDIVSLSNNTSIVKNNTSAAETELQHTETSDKKKASVTQMTPPTTMRPVSNSPSKPVVNPAVKQTAPPVTKSVVKPIAKPLVKPIPVVEPDEDFDIDFDYEPLDTEHKTRVSLPAVIQFSIVANADQGFNGLHLFKAFQAAGLQYGSLKIFERIDEQRMVNFGVACMVEPGTFPDKNLESFYSPGIVFFMQHGHLEDARSVFEDYLDTIDFLAAELDGTIWDHQRQPLTDATVDSIRRSL